MLLSWLAQSITFEILTASFIFGALHVHGCSRVLNVIVSVMMRRRFHVATVMRCLMNFSNFRMC